MDDTKAQELVLEAMNNPLAYDNRLAGGRAMLIERANQYAPTGDRMGQHQFFRAVWALVAQGLAYIDFSQPSPDNWSLELTDAGRRAANDREYLPDRVPAYLRRISEDVPMLGAVCKLYLEEALASFSSANYLSSGMMLGVAIEACFYDLAYSFCDWVPDGSWVQLKDSLDKEGKSYIQKFNDFRSRLEAAKGHLPTGFKQSLDLHLHAILELFRVMRNSIGHPTGTKLSREDAFSYLVLFPTFARRAYQLKDYFDKNKRA